MSGLKKKVYVISGGGQKIRRTILSDENPKEKGFEELILSLGSPDNADIEFEIMELGKKEIVKQRGQRHPLFNPITLKIRGKNKVIYHSNSVTDGIKKVKK